jgi:hypothetical protein
MTSEDQKSTRRPRIFAFTIDGFPGYYGNITHTDVTVTHWRVARPGEGESLDGVCCTYKCSPASIVRVTRLILRMRRYEIKQDALLHIHRGAAIATELGIPVED